MIRRTFLKKFHNIKHHLQYIPGDPDYEPYHKKQKIKFYYEYKYRYRILPELFSIGEGDKKFNKIDNAVGNDFDYWDFEYYGQWNHIAPKSIIYFYWFMLILMLFSIFYENYLYDINKNCRLVYKNPFPHIFYYNDNAWDRNSI